MGVDLFNRGIGWVIRNGNYVIVWFEDWTGLGTLSSLISGPLQPGEENLVVANLFGKV